jgi:hypothetical protein
LSVAVSVVNETVKELEAEGTAKVTVGAVVSEGGGADASAAAIACTSAEVRPLRKPIPPSSPSMATCIREALLPRFSDVAKAPWQSEQFVLYKAAPFTGGGVVVVIVTEALLLAETLPAASLAQA